MAFVQNTQSWIRRYGAPVTLALIVSQIVIGLITFGAMAKGIAPFALSQDSLSRPWTLLTYSFVSIIEPGLGFIFFIFGILWLHWVGGSAERDLGSLRYAAFWVIVSVLFGAVLVLGSHVVPATLLLYGPMLPMAALTVVWGTRNPAAQMQMFGALPLNGTQLCYFDAAFVLIGIGWQTHQPVLGIVACVPLYISFLFASNKLGPISYSRPVYAAKPSKASQEREEAYFDEVRRREKERDERERLRKLFEVHDNDQTGS